MMRGPLAAMIWAAWGARLRAKRGDSSGAVTKSPSAPNLRAPAV